MSTEWRQIHAAFRFRVDIEDTTEAVFTECELPSIKWEMEEIKEGGLNSFVHQLPGRRNATIMTLKKGVARAGLMDWYVQCMGEPPYTRRPISVTLFDSRQQSIAVWNIDDAFPVSWIGPDLKAGDSAVAIQTLRLACGEVTVE